MGKRMLCQKIALDWATTEWDDFFTAIVLFLRCKDVNSLRCEDGSFNIIREAINRQLLPQDVDKEDKDIFFKFIVENQSKVLLLFEGLNEALSAQTGLYKDIAESRILSECSIVFTSGLDSHDVKTEVLKCCDTLWEIEGFAQEHAEMFIRKFFSTKGKDHLAEKLIERLTLDDDTSKPLGNIRMLAKNPLHTAILCNVFEEVGGVLPANSSDLFTKVILYVLKRYEIKNGSSSSELSDLFSSSFKEELFLMGKLAFNSLCNGHLHFETSEEMLKSKIFGFFSFKLCSSKLTPSESHIFCEFIDKRFQQFLGGFFLASQILKEELDCASVVADDRYSDELKQVFLFMAGIIASQSNETAESLVLSIILEINSALRTANKDVVLLMRLACECISECSYNHDYEEHLSSIVGTHLDLSTLHNLALQNSGIHAAGAAAIAMSLIRNTSLTHLDLRDNSIGDRGASCLFTALLGNSSLTHIDLRDNNIGDDCASHLIDALTKNSSLTHLDLRNNRIGAEVRRKTLETNRTGIVRF